MNAGTLVRAALFLVPFFLSTRLWADVENSPPHSHDPSPVTTFGAGPAGQHQHRTNHDPKQGVFVHSNGAGAAAYTATKVWVGRNQHALADGHDPFAHGHQGHEIDFGRFAIDLASWPAADRVNVEARVTEAFAAWVAVGNASGAKNWPNGEDHMRDGSNNVVSVPGTGVPWHSSVDWRKVALADPHEVKIEFSNVDLGAGDLAAYFPTGTHKQHIHVRTNPSSPWAYDLGTGSAAVYDFASTILHEVGHAVGFGHFGSYTAAQIMNSEDQPRRNDLTSGGVMKPAGSGVLRTIDADATHGVLDLYSIAVPEPGTLMLLAIGNLAMWGRRQRRG